VPATDHAIYASAVTYPFPEAHNIYIEERLCMFRLRPPSYESTNRRPSRGTPVFDVTSHDAIVTSCRRERIDGSSHCRRCYWR